MAKPGGGLVPITRSFLAKFYDEHPLDPISPELHKLQERVVALTDASEAERKKLPDQEEDMIEALSIKDIPHKLDQNFWKNREELEEIIFLLKEENWPAALKVNEGGAARTAAQEELVEALKKWNEELQNLHDFIASYQKSTSDKIANMVYTYLPQDFRGTLFRQMKERSEKRREVEVTTLVANGGTIKQKYALYWQQQMDRRTSLASLGAATGMYRAIVTYLAGVPQVLLDFVKTINDHNGPMEEQRIRYGPHLYELTAFVNKLHVFIASWLRTLDSSAVDTGDATGLVTDSIRVYNEEVTKFVNKLQDTFEKAPFFISADEALSEEEKKNAAEDFKEETINAGVAFTVPVSVEEVGTVVAWDFKLTYGKDVGFSVEYIAPGGTKTGVFPYVKGEAHQGSFNAPGAGDYNLVWDNSYSYLTRKVLRYKVGAIPPMETAEQVAAEEALTHPEEGRAAAPAPAPAAAAAAAAVSS